jgi:mRNA interferase MazF
MPSFEPGTIVKVPFPYTDRATRQRRPALVLPGPDVDTYRLLWVVMITSAENRSWPCDVAIENYAAAGLPAPSVVRPAKIATIDAQDAEPLGTLNSAEFDAVLGWLKKTLSIR